MCILSDIHGNFRFAYDACKTSNDVVQIGDLGIFVKRDLNLIPKTMRFFAGNHDNYKLMVKHPGWLGRYGYIDDNTFYVSGAYSVDKEYRIKDLSWWDYEELSYQEACGCLEMYKGCKVLLSHDTNQDIVNRLGVNERSHTRNLISMLIKKSRPEINVFGHHHINFEKKIDGVFYRGIAKNTWVDL